ncbi:hypothetical protein TNCV_1405361 [Trichonephila clavipes]|nr:hypothetical protein TNCV_1405361 [Trichonephila clavipes]
MEPPLAPKRLKQEPSEGSNNIILWVPRHHPLMQLGHNGFLIQPTNVNVDFFLLSIIKQRSETSRFILHRDMEHELAFTLHLAMYQEADLEDYITFMMNFRVF